MMMIQPPLSKWKASVLAENACCRIFRINDPNISPHRLHHIMPSDSPTTAAATSPGPVASTDILNRFGGHESIDCCVSMSKDILRYITLNFDIQLIPSRSGFCLIKVKYGNREM